MLSGICFALTFRAESVVYPANQSGNHKKVAKGNQMTNALTPKSSAQPKIGAETMEKVLIQGDLKVLTPLERVSYYDGVCKSLGLNPLTRPFDYLILNGKLQLYAKRECTEQLRQIHDVSLTIKAREVTDGCYVVTAQASLPNGRRDESIGAVPLEGLKGENRSNAIMKAETKAKRRVTLSICGMTFLDETEVDSVRGASRVAIDPQTGEVLDASNPDPSRVGPIPAATEDANRLAAQDGPARPWRTFRGMLDAFAKLHGRLGPHNDRIYGEVLAEFGVQHSNQFADFRQATAAYNKLLARVREYEAAQNESAAEFEDAGEDSSDEMRDDREATV